MKCFVISACLFFYLESSSAIYQRHQEPDPDIASWDQLYEVMLQTSRTIGISAQEKNSEIINLYKENQSRLFSSISLDDFSMILCTAIISKAFKSQDLKEEINTLNQKKLDAIENLVENGDRSHENFGGFVSQLYSAYLSAGETEKANNAYALILEQSVNPTTIETEEKELDTDALYQQIRLAQLRGDHQKAIDLYDKKKSLLDDKNLLTFDRLIMSSFQSLGLEDRIKASENKMSHYALNQMTEMVKENPQFASILAMQSQLPKNPVSQITAEEQKIIANTSQITSIEERIGVIDSSNRYDPNETFEYAKPMMKGLIENSSLSVQQKQQALKLAENNDMASYMKITAMIQGTSDEEMQQNMQQVAQKINSELGNKAIEVSEHDDLESITKKIDNYRDELVKQSSELSKNAMDRHDDGLYDPVVMIQNLRNSISLFESLSWPNDDHIRVMDKVMKEHKTDIISLEESADLFVDYWKKENALATPTEEQNLRTDFIDGMKNYSDQLPKIIPEAIEIQKWGRGLVNQENRNMLDFDSFDSYLATRPMVKGIPILKKGLKAYEKFSNLRDKRTINDLRFESNQLEELAKYKNINLNVFISMMEEPDYDPFKTIEHFAMNYDQLLGSKGADYRAKMFLDEGVRASSSIPLKKDYDELRKLRLELGLVHLLPDSLLIKNGWTKERFESEVTRANTLQQKIYKQIRQGKDFVSFANHWIISWKDIQSLLSAGEAFVDIHRVQSLEVDTVYSYLYAIIQPNKEPDIFVINKSEVDIERGFIGYRNSVNHQVEYKKGFHDFWNEVAKRLIDVNKVYLSPDGIYHNIALGGLKNPSNDNYLSDDLDIVRLVEISDIKRIKNEKFSNPDVKSIHLFGLPDYDQKETNSGKGNDKRSTLVFAGNKGAKPLKELRGTEREVDAIKLIASARGLDTWVYKKKEATEEALKKLEYPSIVHLATHGKFFGKVGTSEPNVFGSYATKYKENPLLRSHIYLAGSNRSLMGESTTGEDGILTGEEVSHLDLSQTELVVLSACESGLGEAYTGEGVFGLQRAFLQAGVTSLIVTLWEVDDYATKDFMISFYQYWLMDNHTKRKAFLMAKEKLKKDKPNPYFWSPFIFIGN